MDLAKYMFEIMIVIFILLGVSMFFLGKYYKKKSLKISLIIIISLIAIYCVMLSIDMNRVNSLRKPIFAKENGYMGSMTRYDGLGYKIGLEQGYDTGYITQSQMTMFGQVIAGAITKSELGEERPLTNTADVIFTIEIGNKSCVPVNLALYKDGTYELFTEYKTCRPGNNCNSMLKYTKSIKGIFGYDVIKIIEDDNIEVDKSYSMDNLPEYEIYMGNSYVEKGYGYYYTIEKGHTNKYLEEFLKEIDVDLKICAEPRYID